VLGRTQALVCFFAVLAQHCFGCRMLQLHRPLRMLQARPPGALAWSPSYYVDREPNEPGPLGEQWVSEQSDGRWAPVRRSRAIRGFGARILLQPRPCNPWNFSGAPAKLPRPVGRTKQPGSGRAQPPGRWPVQLFISTLPSRPRGAKQIRGLDEGCSPAGRDCPGAGRRSIDSCRCQPRAAGPVQTPQQQHHRDQTSWQ